MNSSAPESEPFALHDQLLAENAELRRQLEEAEETIEAIRCGAVDALVVEESGGHRIYTLDGAERPYRLFVEAMQQGAATLHADGTIVWCNRQLAEILKSSCEALLGTSLANFISPPSREIYENLLWQGQTRSGRGEAQVIRTDGAPVHVFLTFNCLPPDSGAAIGVLVTDLTPQRHHQQLTAAHTALRETQRRLALVTDTAPVYIACCDRHARFTFVNRPYAARFGLEPADLIGKTVPEVLGQNIHDLFREQVQTVLSGKAVEFEKEVPYQQLGRRFMHCSYAPDFGPDGSVIGYVAAITDISARKEVEEQLRRNHDTFFNLVENAPFGVHIVDAEFRLRQVSAGSRKVFSTVSPLLGRDFAEIMHQLWDEPFATEAIARFRHTLETGEPYTAANTTEQRHDIGEVESYDWKIERLTLPDGQYGVVCYFYDITERKRVEEALRESERRYRELFDTAEAARQRAEAATRARDDFLAALSHELRTPLNPALLLASSLAGDTSLSASVREDLATISNGITLQVRLVDDLLDLTRITGGKLKLALELVDVHEALRQALEMVNAEIRERRLTVTLDLQASRHSILADSVRLQQVFWNVLKNAVKFTPPGGTITVRTLLSPEHTADLIVEISDTGTGIAPDMLDRIFDSFAQEEHDGAHRFGGLGLGLAISRRLVEMHRGAIRAFSDGRGHGSTFRIQLPLSSAGTVVPDKIPHPVFRPAGRRILLVEDHDMTRATLSRLLERRGHTVFPAGTAAEARHLAAARQCDLVISDLGLPDCDGYTLMTSLRSSLGLPGIAMSGYGTEADVSRSHASGFFHHLTKPVGIHNLEAAIAAAPYQTGDQATT